MPNQLTNINAIKQELDWLESCIHFRLKQYFQNENVAAEKMPPPPLFKENSLYKELVSQYNLRVNERLVLALALAAEVAPQILDVLKIRNSNIDALFTEMGMEDGGQLPTLRLAAFLCNEENGNLFLIPTSLTVDTLLLKKEILYLLPRDYNKPMMMRKFTLNPQWLNQLTELKIAGTNEETEGVQYKVTSPLRWEELFLNMQIREKIQWVVERLRKNETQGTKILFHGPAAIGKRLAALTMASQLGRESVVVDGAMLATLTYDECRAVMQPVLNQVRSGNMVLVIHQTHFLFNPAAIVSEYRRNLWLFNLQNIAVVYCLDWPQERPEFLKPLLDEEVFFYHVDAPENIWAGMFKGEQALSPEIDIKALADKYELTPGVIHRIWQKACLISKINEELKVSQNALQDAIDDILQIYTPKAN